MRSVSFCRAADSLFAFPPFFFVSRVRLGEVFLRRGFVSIQIGLVLCQTRHLGRDCPYDVKSGYVEEFQCPALRCCVIFSLLVHLVQLAVTVVFPSGSVVFTTDARTVYTVVSGTGLVTVSAGGLVTPTGSGFGTAVINVTFPTYSRASNVWASVTVRVDGAQVRPQFSIEWWSILV